MATKAIIDGGKSDLSFYEFTLTSDIVILTDRLRERRPGGVFETNSDIRLDPNSIASVSQAPLSPLLT